MKKIFLTAATVMCCITPALADGYYQAGSTSVYSCNVGLLGAENLDATSVTMEAQYSQNCPAGQYLLVDNNNPNGICTLCYDSTNPSATTNLSAGTFCPGIKEVVITNGMPLTQGSIACPSGYDMGTSTNAITGCLKTCPSTVACLPNTDCDTDNDDTDDYVVAVPNNRQVAYATTYCEAAFDGCDAGYNAKKLKDTDDDPSNNDDYLGASIGVSGINSTSNAISWTMPLTNAGPLTAAGGIYYCAETSGVFSCYAKITTLTDGTNTVETNANAINLTSALNGSTFNYYTDCVAACKNASDYAVSGWASAGISTALLNTIGEKQVCVANDITIRWYNMHYDSQSQTLVRDANAIDQTSCTYGGGLETLSKPSLNGYTFLGWKQEVESGN